MTDSDLIKRSSQLREMTSTIGFQIFRQEVENRIKDGWEEFINLPPDQKTAKKAYHYQAQYKVLKDLLDWLEDEISSGGKAEKRFASQLERAGVKTT